MSHQDAFDVVQVVNLYAIAVDTLRLDLFDLVFTQDCTVDFGGPAKWTDLASLKRDFATVHTPFDATMHTTANHRVTVEGDRAFCISYVHGRFIRQVSEGGNMFESGGWYDDELTRTSGGWRIKTRNCRSVWAAGNPIVLQTMPGVTGEHQLFALSREAEAGRIGFLKAMRRMP